MSDTSKSKTNTTSEEPKAGHHPYAKPKIIWESDIDELPVLAMACARAVLQDAQCATGGLAS